LILPTGEFELKSFIDTPSLVLDLDIFKSNVKELLKICNDNGVSLQPHAKTHRTPELGLLQQELGCDGLCVAKVGEAEGFAKAGIKKITIAYPILGSNKVERALILSTSIDLTLAVDSLIGAESIGYVFNQHSQVCPVLLIIDSGLARDGVRPENAPMIAKVIDAVPGIKVVGIMTHEGVVYGAPDRESMVASAQQASEMMVSVAKEIAQAGVHISRVSMGASASARIAPKIPGVNQVRPGIFAFNDLGQIALGNATYGTCAVRVLSTIVSRPTSDTAVMDAGSKSLSADLLPVKELRGQFPGHGLIVGKLGWIIERLSEEHGMLKWIGGGSPQAMHIGEQIQIIPNHVCTVFSSLNESVVISRGEIVDRWRTFPPGASR
jgi:D-serine deaminase-like pyridoxal phosphate-dependent protein